MKNTKMKIAKKEEKIISRKIHKGAINDRR